MFDYFFFNSSIIVLNAEEISILRTLLFFKYELSKTAKVIFDDFLARISQKGMSEKNIVLKIEISSEFSTMMELLKKKK